MAHARNALSGFFIASGRRELHAIHLAVHQPFHYYGGAYSFGAWKHHLIPPPSQYGGEGSSLSICVPPTDNSASMVGIKPGDSGVVIGYQVDEFMLTGLAECCVA